MSIRANRAEVSLAPRYMTAEQTAAYIGSTVKTIRTWTSRRKIPAIRKGRFVRYDRLAIDTWMQKDAVKPLAPLET